MGVPGRRREEAANKDLFGIFRQPDKSRVRPSRSDLTVRRTVLLLLGKSDIITAVFRPHLRSPCLALLHHTFS